MAMRKEAKKHVDKKDLTICDILNDNQYRISIFGSARTQPDHEVYRQTFELAKWIGEREWGLVTGGGPGVMEAANAGHAAGDVERNSDSIGLMIELPFENEGNDFLEISKRFDRFSHRLDHFMGLSHVAVVMPGGIGTCLELFYAWQLVQVHHVKPMPIILVGEMWPPLVEWVRKELVERGLVSPEDLDNIHVVTGIEEAQKLIEKEYNRYIDNGIDFNVDRYSLEEFCR